MSFPRLTDRLIASSVLGAVLMVWVLLVGVDSLGAFAGQLGDMSGEHSLSSALIFILWTLPRRAYTLFPFAAVIGSLLGLGTLATSSELTALRAVGLSKQRIVMSAFWVIGALTLAMVLVAETLGPYGEQQGQSLAMAAKSADVSRAKGSGLWAREGDTFINAREGKVAGTGVNATIELFGVTLYEFDPQGRLASIASVGRATHQQGAWTLYDIRRSRFLARSVESRSIEQEQWHSALNPDALKLGVSKPRYLSIAELSAGLEYLHRNELDASEFEHAYWSRFFYPLNVIVLFLAAAPFAFGSLRSGGFGKRLFIGMIVGVSFFVLQTLAGNLAQVYHVALPLAFLLPPLVLAGGSWLYFHRRV